VTALAPFCEQSLKGVIIGKVKKCQTISGQLLKPLNTVPLDKASRNTVYSLKTNTTEVIGPPPAGDSGQDLQEEMVEDRGCGVKSTRTPHEQIIDLSNPMMTNNATAIACIQ
jgi:hypothetical protein